ncbi:hypothetical protein PRK78_005485 [Emydomyces testavorans]|uniref:PWI domain-containing protein n=1 Tax=Emydomyces testavorans TaxID=2070801 RepID=A0AAF0DKB7_9EURO|nr:hypothetical protein PRK78_005485 [Emydomyces testavorans]
MATNVDAKLLKQTKFPPEFNTKVDMTKVNVEVMKKWIAGKISDILGNEDDVVIELCFNLLEGSRFPNIKHLQIQLTGFLDKDTPKFCKDLWNLCISAQNNPQGVPKELLEAKKLELIQEKLDAEKAAEEVRRQKEEELAREREVEAIRRREREERGRRGRNRGRAGSRDFGRRNHRDSRSPPPRRRSPDRYRRPRGDTYAPTEGEEALSIVVIDQDLVLNHLAHVLLEHPEASPVPCLHVIAEANGREDIRAAPLPTPLLVRAHRRDTRGQGVQGAAVAEVGGEDHHLTNLQKTEENPELMLPRILSFAIIAGLVEAERADIPSLDAPPVEPGPALEAHLRITLDPAAPAVAAMAPSERGISLLKDMLPLPGDSAKALQSPHPQTSQKRRLIRKKSKESAYLLCVTVNLPKGLVLRRNL